MKSTTEEKRMRAVNIEKCVQEWFAEHPDVRAVYAKDLLPYLMEKNVIKRQVNPNHVLIYTLRKCWERNELAAVAPSARLYGNSWIFARTEQDEPPHKENARTAAMRKFNLTEAETYVR